MRRFACKLTRQSTPFYAAYSACVECFINSVPNLPLTVFGSVEPDGLSNDFLRRWSELGGEIRDHLRATIAK
jgi:hypothetical protein